MNNMLPRCSSISISEALPRRQTSEKLCSCSADTATAAQNSRLSQNSDKAARKQSIQKNSQTLNGAPVESSPQLARSRNRRTTYDLWSAVIETALQEGARSSQGLVASTEQALARVNRLLTPLPEGFPAGDFAS